MRGEPVDYPTTMQRSLVKQEDLARYLFLAYILYYPRETSEKILRPGLALLTEDERHAYESKHAYPRRVEFLLSRVLLRRILSTLLDCSPQSFRLQATLHGKPQLGSSLTHQEPLFFNFSHSERIILLGVSHHGEIGVDVEVIRHYQPRIAQRFFSAEEYAWLECLAPELQAAAFTHLWTVKEACAKAIGLGLQFPLRAIPVCAQHSGHYQNLYWQTLASDPAAKSAVAIETSPNKQHPVRGILTQVSYQWLLTGQEEDVQRL